MVKMETKFSAKDRKEGFPVRKKTRRIVVHCSATPATADVGFAEINEWHLKRGWGNGKVGCGYHEIIRRDGSIEAGRDLSVVGAHCQGHNSDSIGICMVGGVDERGVAAGNFTSPQFLTLARRVKELREQFPDIEDVCGHRDLSPDLDGDGVIEKHEWLKDCPSFDVREWLSHPAAQ